jgi:hypothetical protein
MFLICSDPYRYVVEHRKGLADRVQAGSCLDFSGLRQRAVKPGSLLQAEDCMPEIFTFGFSEDAFASAVAAN